MRTIQGAVRGTHRLSFISYRLAAIKNVNQVALEAGNSSQMIFANYRELVTEAKAARWFAIKPATAENVVAMPKENVG